MSRIVNRAGTAPLAYQASGTFQQSTDASLQTMLGTRWDLEDGRELTLVLAGASNLAVGKLMQDAAVIANHQDLAVTAFTAYSTTTNLPAQVTVTLNGTAATLNQYQLGYAFVVDGTGAGQSLQIQENPAQATTTGSLVITLADSPNTALDTTSKISLFPQPGNGVIVNPTTPTNAPRGVTFYPITAAQYGFLATKGQWSVLADSSAPTVGLAISPSTTTAGSIETFSTDTPVIGQTIYATVSAKYYPVVLDL
jgi:hypothetical protein